LKKALFVFFGECMHGTFRACTCFVHAIVTVEKN